MLDWELCLRELKNVFRKGTYPVNGYEFLWLARTFLVPGPRCYARNKRMLWGFLEQVIIYRCPPAMRPQPCEVRDASGRH
jgi:hypothetical protein